MPGAGELRVLRRRIRSVKSTQKITRAMELIAASRISRARRAVDAARPYAEGITRVIRDLASEGEVANHPLLREHDDVRRVGIVVISSDRGLAGAYNTNVLRRAERLAKEERAAGREAVIYAVGRKGETYFRYRGERPVKVWTGITDQPRYDDAVRIAEEVGSAYWGEEINRLWLCYTRFRSALTQISETRKVMPVDEREISGGVGFPAQFEFEPSPQELLTQLIPRYVEHQLYAALMESSASEHASRQRAMKAATDNAGDVINDLTREANRARQAAITTEISEIVGGAEALAAEK